MMTTPAERGLRMMNRCRKASGFSVLRVFFALAIAIPVMLWLWKHHYDQVWDGVDEQVRPFIESERKRIEEYVNSEEGKADIAEQKRMQQLAREIPNYDAYEGLGGEPDEEDMQVLRQVAREERKRIEEYLESEEGKKYMEEQRRLQQKARETIKY